MGKGFMEFTCHLCRFFISLSSMAGFFGTLLSGEASKVRAKCAQMSGGPSLHAGSLPPACLVCASSQNRHAKQASFSS